MSRALIPAAIFVSGLVLASSAGGALEVRLSISPNHPVSLEPTQISLRTFLPFTRADGSCCDLKDGGPKRYPFRVEAVSPRGKVARIRVRHASSYVWRGAFRFPSGGRWTLRVTNFGPTYEHSAGARPRITVRVRPPVPTPRPAGFGLLGRPGCDPPSPADASQKGLRDVYGTAYAHEQLWALPFAPVGAGWARPDVAAFDGLVGKEIKIVFGMTAFHAPFRAVGPSGQTLAPKWGPLFHSGSSWDRQLGVEWGAGFVFPAAGCWRIAVGVYGSVYLSVRS